MSCNCSSNTEILRMFQELKQDLSQVKNDCFRIRQEILGITDASHEFGLMENVTIRQVTERMAFDIETLKARTEPTPERAKERTQKHPDNAKDPVTAYDDSTSAVDRTRTPDFQTQGEYEEWLMVKTNETISETRIADGASIGGQSISSISSSVPAQYKTSLTIEIVNYREEPLVDLQSLVPCSFPHINIPSRVDAKRREVFVYRGDYPSLGKVPVGALSFRMGSVNHRVSIYFWTTSTYIPMFGMALTAFDTTFQDLGWATGSSINWPSQVVPKVSLPTDYVFRWNIGTNSTFSIENDLTYVRATLTSGKQSIWKVEVFPKPEIKDLIPFSKALLNNILPGDSYPQKTALEFMDTVSGTLKTFVEFANGLGIPLQNATSYSSNTISSSDLIPNIITSAKKEIMCWATTSRNLQSLITYQIGTSDIRLAVAANADPSSVNKFGLKFVSSNSPANSTIFNEVMTPPEWERNSHKVGRAGGGAIVISVP